jgi:hypothetical protein
MSEVSAVSSDVDSRFVLADRTSSDVQPSASTARFCITCSVLIPLARLRAKPNATQCVSCLCAAGDVAPAREYASRCSVLNATLLSDLTEAPVLPVSIDVTGEQTNEEIVSSWQELDVKGTDTCDEQ